jgi:hypothetical protein
MSDSADAPEPAGAPPPPKLPDVESPAPEDVLEGVPSKEEVVEQAEPVEDIVKDQPSVDEILGRDRER